MNPGLTYGFHTALEGRVLDGVRLTGDNFKKSEDDGDDKSGNSKKNSNDDK